ncbi:glycosyltransferase [Nocardioides dongkuii]|uniref:glycosyltransferase n=1 Tax=Nocardioides dongkuii TaxID=2760089 RepID=UPI001FCF9F80|nr:glycosyltransferase [Nocardioides dongkuii]
MTTLDGAAVPVHTVSVVVPVYGGESHLRQLAEEVAESTTDRVSPDGHVYRVSELLLVDDCGPDRSDEVIRELEATHSWVRGVWLSRNFGQHAATIAGMASSGAEWIVTLDEDGQHDPAEIGVLLDSAMRHQSTLVYAAPVNAAPHTWFRRVTSRVAKRVVNVLSGGQDASVFQSYRLMTGEVGRSVAAYAGSGIYLDVALGWVASVPSTAPVHLREEAGRPSGYRTRTLLSHFWRLVVSSGTRSLRLASLLGVACATLGLLLAGTLVLMRVFGDAPVQGWTSLMVVMLLCTGLLLFVLGIVAEYLGVAVGMAMGKPLYVITQDRARGPLGRGRGRP